MRLHGEEGNVLIRGVSLGFLIPSEISRASNLSLLLHTAGTITQVFLPSLQYGEENTGNICIAC